jgi:hemerythrin
MAKKLFDFDSEFRLGIESVDSEHVKLVDMLNEVHTLLSEGKRDEARRHFNEALSSYIDEHFANEEKFMEGIGFPHLAEHKKIHENFRQSFYGLRPLVESSDDVAFRSALSDAFTWLIAHIGKTDKKYAIFHLEKQGTN